MANELRVLGQTTGSTIYAVSVRDSDEKVWNGSDFVTRVNADQPDYAITMTETPIGSRIWLGDVPDEIDDGLRIHVDYYNQLGVDPDNDTDEILGGEDMYASGNTDIIVPATSTLISIPEYDAAVPNTLPSSMKAFVIAAATAAIERYCQRKLVQEVGREEVVDGSGFGYVQLGAIPVSIVSVTLYFQSDHESVIDGDEFAWTTAGLLYLRPDAEDASYIPCGFQNAMVTYTSSGAVAYDLKQACVQVVQAMLRRADPDLLVTTKSVGMVTMKWEGAIDLNEPIFSDVKELLAPYRALLCI